MAREGPYPADRTFRGAPVGGPRTVPCAVCGTPFDLVLAPWCDGHDPHGTPIERCKLCPAGHALHDVPEWWSKFWILRAPPVSGFEYLIVPRAPCPRCGSSTDGDRGEWTAPEWEFTPEVPGFGDVLLCASCGAVLVFDDAVPGAVRPIRAEEEAKLGNELRQTLDRGQAHIRERRRSP